jgi:polyribonucleotide nucleotidyltransferase
MSKEEKIVSTQWLGRELTFKTGKLAKQANAAVLAQYGETVVMATVVESKEERDTDFFPLMVDFEEKLYAAGIIKGSRWIKREGRPSDEAVLTGRMIDRSIRPLFDDTSRKEVQVILTTLSVDRENDHHILSLLAASAALSISGVKWNGPIAGIRVGRTDGRLVFNPTYKEQETSDLDMIVAGTTEKTIMIEAGAQEVPESAVGQAINQALVEMKPALDLINKFKNDLEIPVPAEQADIAPDPDKIEAEKSKEQVLAQAKQWLADHAGKYLFDKSYYTKGERKLAVAAIKNELTKYLADQGIGEDHRKMAVKKLVDEYTEAEVSRAILKEGRRVDGRALDEIRPLTAEAGLLPRNHGSGLFSRGETQTLSIVTLGAPGLEQSLEGLEGESKKRFMHHYNFPPYSVGEAKFMRGPGRREIGHGALAEKALVPIIPAREEFPYTIRIVSETLGSNGSSSMAAATASTLALMDAGIPISKPVGGIAMGLASNKDMSEWKVITDIQDLEDGKGGMDFKITGTKDGLTAIQLDTKTNGLTKEIIEKTLTQGRQALNQVLKVITDAISEPRPDLSKYAPRLESFHINPERIRDVIGPGGKIINMIIDETDVSIDIEDDGLVMVCGTDAENVKRAVKWIEDLTHEFEAGETVSGKVTRLMDFGAFVGIGAGKEGMVHVSEMAPYRVTKPADLVSVGDEVEVKVKEIDDLGRINLTMAGLPGNQELWDNKREKAQMQGNGRPPQNNRPQRDNNGRSNHNSRPPHRAK